MRQAVSTVRQFLNCPIFLTMQPTAIQVAGDLHRIHKIQNGKPIYAQEDIVNLLIMYEIAAPDFEGYAKLSKTTGARSQRNKKKLNVISQKIKAAMKESGIKPKDLAKMANKSVPEIYRWRKAQNLTLLTLFEIESLLNIKLTNT